VQIQKKRQFLKRFFVLFELRLSRKNKNIISPETGAFFSYHLKELKLQLFFSIIHACIHSWRPGRGAAGPSSTISLFTGKKNESYSMSLREAKLPLCLCR
jgi:hypothetical protein